MNKIEITVLSARVLDALSVRGLKAKTVREFERYGTRRIVQHCLDNGQTIYFKETVQDFVWQERARMESGALPHYQWVLTRRAAVYLDQMAKHGKIQGEPLRSWEAEHNPLFQNAPHSPSNSMKVIDIICRTRDAVIQLELSDKTKTNYIYCGFGPILNFFASRGEEFYSPETLALFVNKAKENYANGTIPKASFQTMRKAARWIEECLSTGRVSQRKLRKYNFACAPPEFENLLSQYQLYIPKKPEHGILPQYRVFLPMKSTVEIPAAKNAIHRIHYPCKRNAIRVNSPNIISKKAILPLSCRQILRKYKHCFHKSVHIVHRCTAIRLQKWLSANFVEKCFRLRPMQMVCGSGTARRISWIQPNAP